MSIPLSMRTCVLRHTIAAGAIGVPGAFAAHADIPFLIALWAKMFYELAEKTENGLDKKAALRLATALGTAVGTTAAGAKAANTYFTAVSGGLALPFTIAVNSSANALGTYIIGMAAADLLTKKELTAADLINAVLAGATAGLLPGGGNSPASSVSGGP